MTRRPNYKQQKKQRELAKKLKQVAKHLRRVDRKGEQTPPEPPATTDVPISDE